MPHKLIVNKGVEEQVYEYEDIERAFDAALPWVMKGYIARMTDEQGVVQYTQALASGQVLVYRGDATGQRPGPTRQAGVAPSGDRSRKPWWRFW